MIVAVDLKVRVGDCSCGVIDNYPYYYYYFGTYSYVEAARQTWRSLLCIIINVVIVVVVATTSINITVSLSQIVVVVVVMMILVVCNSLVGEATLGVCYSAGSCCSHMWLSRMS